MIREKLQNSAPLQPWAIEEFNILKVAPRKDFEELTFITRQVCNTPVAALYFRDHEKGWLHSVSGTEASMLPEPGVLAPLISRRKVLYQEDFISEYFIQPPLLGEFSFYAGVPLINSKEEVLGVLVLLDTTVRRLSDEQEIALISLGDQILNLVNFQKQHNELKAVQQKLREKYKDLEKFASVVSHDIKSPLANIISLTEFLKEENKENVSDETRQYLDFLMQSSYSLRNYVDGILTFYRSDNILEKEKEDVDLPKFLKGIAHLYRVDSNVEIVLPESGILHKVNKAAISQIFMNLISNALKYNNKEFRKVLISFREEDGYYFFEVKDNGNGIPEKDFEKIFDLFSTLDHNDRDGHPGSGIGLATVKKMLDHMDGSIELESELGKGSNFKFRIKRK